MSESLENTMADHSPPQRPQEAVRQVSESGDESREVVRDSNGWRRPPASRQRQAYAAIDLGTNNCRLLIARPANENFVVVDAFSRVVRLGEGLAQTGRLSEAAMDRAVGALKICADKLRRRNVHLARSVATEACRRASNGEAFIERVRQETGIMLDIISAEEEARLAVLGCHILLEDGRGPAMIFDIGGGSTELVLIEPGGPVPQIIDWLSVPWGVVSLTETVGQEREHADPDERAARYAEMRRLVSESFALFAKRVAPHRAPDLRLLGTSGTVTTLASVHLELPQYDRSAVDGLIVPASSMRDISARLSGLAPADRRKLPCIGTERADLVVAGCAILESILDIWPAARLGVADRGIREGILRSLMAADFEGSQARAGLKRVRGA
jgi:exopolyphosphatase/guanosine-5'-triphosphate,3'-diphosphate pyrophosphatase